MLFGSYPERVVGDSDLNLTPATNVKRLRIPAFIFGAAFGPGKRSTSPTPGSGFYELWWFHVTRVVVDVRGNICTIP